MGPDLVEKAQVVRREEDAAERLLDEPRVLRRLAQQAFQILRPQDRLGVLDQSFGQHAGEAEKVVRGHLFSHALEEVGHAATAGERVQNGVELHRTEDLVKPGKQAVLAAHEPELRIILRARRELGRERKLGTWEKGCDRHGRMSGRANIPQLGESRTA